MALLRIQITNLEVGGKRNTSTRLQTAGRHTSHHDTVAAGYLGNTCINVVISQQSRTPKGVVAVAMRIGFSPPDDNVVEKFDVHRLCGLP